MKNAVNQWVFKIFPIFFPTWSVIIPLFYMWFNIDIRGNKKAQKSQNKAVGPEDPPLGKYQDPKPRMTKG